MTTLLSASQQTKKQPVGYNGVLEKQAEPMLVEETSELLAAIDEGLRSAETE